MKATRERCPVCDWPMEESRENGCAPGDCAYRPREGSAEHRRIEARRAERARDDDRGEPPAIIVSGARAKGSIFCSLADESFEDDDQALAWILAQRESY